MTTPAQSHLPPCGLVLSLYPGAGLLDLGFIKAGFCVVRGPDILLGQDVRTFTLKGLGESHQSQVHSQPGKSRFDGIIGGPPCQDYSRARRRPPVGYGDEMLFEYIRIVTEGQPDWWLAENVPGVPTIRIEGYTTQRFNMFASDFGLDHRRNRSFQFGSKSEKLVIARGSQSHMKMRPTPLASDYARSRNRNFADTCERMGIAPGIHASRPFQTGSVSSCWSRGPGRYGRSCCDCHSRSANHSYGRVTALPVRLWAPAHREAEKRYTCLSKAAAAPTRTSCATDHRAFELGHRTPRPITRRVTRRLITVSTSGARCFDRSAARAVVRNHSSSFQCTAARPWPYPLYPFHSTYGDRRKVNSFQARPPG